jgi:hypothetical protein
MRMRHIILSPVACPAPPYFFSRYLINGTIFGKKLLNIKCVFWLYLQILSQTFLILRTIQRDTVINVYKSSCKVPVILFRCLWNSNFLDIFCKNIQISSLIKIRPVGAELFHADRQTWWSLQSLLEILRRTRLKSVKIWILISTKALPWFWGQAIPVAGGHGNTSHPSLRHNQYK